jgi:hypothetical protein
VKERRGAISRATGLAEGVAAAVRRMARDREPHVIVYDAAGYARLLQPESRGHERVLELSARTVELVDAASERGRGAAGERDRDAAGERGRGAASDSEPGAAAQ